MSPFDFDGNVLIGDASSVALDGSTEDGGDDAGADRAETGPSDGATGDANVGDLGPEPDAGAPDSGTCSLEPTETLNVTEAEMRAAELDGQVIALVGTATTGTVRCTRISCPADDPCCNTCTAPLLIDGEVAVVASECFEEVGCEGDSCSMLLVCRPPADPVARSYVGRLRMGPPLELELIEVR